jgi:quinol monooxygenase YgiN
MASFDLLMPGTAAALLAGTMAVRAETGSDSVYAAVPDGTFSVVAEIHAEPGKEAELRVATLPLSDLVRGDPKNLGYSLQEDRFSSGQFVFFEVFASEADFEAHNAQLYVRARFAKLHDLALGGVQAMKMRFLQHSIP